MYYIIYDDSVFVNRLEVKQAFIRAGYFRVPQRLVIQLEVC